MEGAFPLLARWLLERDLRDQHAPVNYSVGRQRWLREVRSTCLRFPCCWQPRSRSKDSARCAWSRDSPRGPPLPWCSSICFPSRSCCTILCPRIFRKISGLGAACWWSPCTARADLRWGRDW